MLKLLKQLKSSLHTITLTTHLRRDLSTPTELSTMIEFLALISSAKHIWYELYKPYQQLSQSQQSKPTWNQPPQPTQPPQKEKEWKKKAFGTDKPIKKEERDAYYTHFDFEEESEHEDTIDVGYINPATP